MANRSEEFLIKNNLDNLVISKPSSKHVYVSDAIDTYIESDLKKMVEKMDRYDADFSGWMELDKDDGGWVRLEELLKLFAKGEEDE